MSVYYKDSSGNMNKIAGAITQRQNARWFLCTRSESDGVEYYTISDEAISYFTSIDAYTVYSLGFNEPNTTESPKLKFGDTELTIYDFTNTDGKLNIGQLSGVYQMFTQDLDNDPKMYICGSSHIDAEVNPHKLLLLGAEGVLESGVYNFTVDNAETYSSYKVNNTLFLVDLNLPITGALELDDEIAITFGDTVYYVYNILKGQEHVTMRDLHQVDKYNNETGYRFIVEMVYFENSDFTGFAVIPTVSNSDVLSLTATQMATYVTSGGLTDGQLAICSSGDDTYSEGSIYRFDITYPSTYVWTEITQSGGLPSNIAVNGTGTALASGTDSIAIGNTANSNGRRSIAIGYNSNASGGSDNVVIGPNISNLINGSYNVVIGAQATGGAGAQYNTIIGYKAGSTTSGAIIAIGYNAKVTVSWGIQIGQGTNSTSNTVHFGGSQCVFNSLSLYNSQVNNTADYHKVAFEEEVKTLTGTEDPTTETVGNVGQLYLNTTSESIYMCTASNFDTPSFTWKQIL